MTPDRPGLWRARYREGFTKDFSVFLAPDDTGRAALHVLPGGGTVAHDPPTVKKMTEILETFGAWWEGPTPMRSPF